jgi:hypothetical protein
MASDDQIDQHGQVAAHQLPIRLRIIIAAMFLFVAITGFAPTMVALIVP